MDGDIGVVILLLGQEGDSVYEGNGGSEGGKRELAGEPFGDNLPAGEGCERWLGFFRWFGLQRAGGFHGGPRGILMVSERLAMGFA
jgi:hypothetical protein